METVVAGDGGEQLKFEDIAVPNTSSGSSVQKEVADPIVYKLVRVGGDGRLVHATDDDVMEVEDKLEDDKNEIHFVAGACQITGGTVTCDVLPEETMLNGLKESEDPKADGEKSNAPHGTALDLEKSDTQPEEIATLSAASSSNDSRICQSSDKECTQLPCELIESVASTSTLCSSSKPDFSKLDGEICLDNLSVKELHETFKATFGRQTSVKDKQWLKRRISMGLSNSCDISMTTFIIRDNKVVKKGKAESCKSTVGIVAKEPLVRVMNDDHGDISVTLADHVGIQLNTCEKREEKVELEKQVDNEFHGTPKTAKRVRKPTKRYIEEVSEFDSREYSGKLLSSVTNSGHEQLSPQVHVRPVQNVQPVSRPLVTRQDSLGGSGIQVPYVSRIRRGRPRENFMALTKIQPSGMGMATNLVKKSLAECDQRSDYEVGNNVSKARLATGWVQKPLISESEEDELYLERKTTELEKDMDSSGDYSDDNVVTVPTSKGGMRRKHHRPWSLSEVVKLVEGVSRYGAGKWSEIKKISFASYSYRTSVDLKDKWRNLIRASFAQFPTENGVQNSRKHGSMPIPTPILLRVRELAEMQSQGTPELNSIKFVGHSGRNVHAPEPEPEPEPGYL